MLGAAAIGIVLGTTTSSMGGFQHANVEIIANKQGSRKTSTHSAKK